MNREDGTHYIHYPDGAVIQIDPGGVASVIAAAEVELSDEDATSGVDSSLDADTVTDSTGDDEPEADVFEAWTAHLPGLFPVNGVNYVNPEAYLGGNNSFTLIDESETQRVYESNGHLVRITQQPGGMFSFEWGSELGNPDLAMDVSADGTPTITYNAADMPEEPVQSQSLGTAIPINFAEETPDVDGESDGEGDSSEETPLFNAEKVLAMPEVEAQPEGLVSREALVVIPQDPDPQPEIEHQEFSRISSESEGATEDIDDDDDDTTGP
jgi:hypothetical protein